MKILYKTLLKALTKTTLLFFIIALICTLIFDYVLKSSATETSIFYFYSLALVRTEHILPFAFILSMTFHIYQIKQNNWLWLLESMTLKKVQIYSIFWLSTFVHLALLLTFYQTSYTRAKQHVNYMRFSNQSSKNKINHVRLSPATTLIYSKRDKDVLENVYILNSSKTGYFCPTLIVSKNNSKGLNVCEFDPNSQNLIKTHKEYIFNTIYKDHFDNQTQNLDDPDNLSIIKTLYTLIFDQQNSTINPIDIKDSLVQKIILLFSPILVFPLILTYINKCRASQISAYFLSCSLFFSLLLCSKLYSLLLKNYLLNSLLPLIYILLAIAIYSIKRNYTYKKKKSNEQNTNMLRKTT